jgi:hypothetical protein
MKHTICSVKGCPDFGRYCRRLHGNEKEETVESVAILLKKAQSVFNLFIRLRDKKKGCISCADGKVEDAGHYLAMGSFSGLRFDEVNVNGQCHHSCNTGKYGNPKAYREGLVKRYGEKAVNDLEKRSRLSKSYKWTRGELIEIIEKYTEKAKRGKHQKLTA